LASADPAAEARWAASSASSRCPVASRSPPAWASRVVSAWSCSTRARISSSRPRKSPATVSVVARVPSSRSRSSRTPCSSASIRCGAAAPACSTWASRPWRPPMLDAAVSVRSRSEAESAASVSIRARPASTDSRRETSTGGTKGWVLR
jgi:hypothetical protein